EEDPTFKVHTDDETGQTIIEGMGELHLEIIIDRLLREFRVDANQGKPQVAYKEAIKREAKGVGRFVRQTGGKGQYGHAEVAARRGHILGMEGRGTSQNVKANVPLAEMFGYATELRSMTSGRATYSMEFSHYAEMPGNLAEAVGRKTASR